MAPLSVEPLQKAISQLDSGLKEYEQSNKNEFLRDGVIQRFKYTYVISCKTLKCFLETTNPSPALIDQMSFSTLIRSAWEQGLLKSSCDVWKNFREAHNNTSHAYDEIKAKEVFSVIPSFIIQAEYLIKQIDIKTQSND